jgi:hypothetical protein
LLCACALIVVTGCTAIPTDMAPKIRWSWSQDARDYRASKKRAELQYEASTNQVIHPTP